MCWESWLMSFQGHSPWCLESHRDQGSPTTGGKKNPTHSYSFRKSQNNNLEKITEPISYIQDRLYFSLHTLPFVLSLGNTREESVPLSAVYIPWQDPPRLFVPSLNNPISHPLLVISVFNPIIPWPLAGHPLVHPCPLGLGAQHWTCHSDVSHWPRVEGQDHLPPPCWQHHAWCSPGSSEFLRPWGCTAGSCSTSCPPRTPRALSAKMISNQLAWCLGFLFLQVQDFIFPFTELHEVPVSPFLHVKVLLNSSTASWCTNNSALSPRSSVNVSNSVRILNW